MATNARFYSNTYNTGAVAHWDTLLTEVRESAKETNKSRSERREELNKFIKDLDDQIGRSQSALEGLNIEHFRAHIRATEAETRRARAGASAGAKLSKELEAIKTAVRSQVSRSLREGAAEAQVSAALQEVQDADGVVTPDILSRISEHAGVLGVLGKHNVQYDRTGGQLDDLSPLEQAKLMAVSLGLQEGFQVGMSQSLLGNVENITGLEASAKTTAGQMTGISPSADALQALAGPASGQIVQGASRRSGGLTNSNIDAMLVESGLALATAQRTADLGSLRAERDLAVREAATLPGAMTEGEILAQAAERMGPVGSLSGEYGPGIIGAFQRKAAAKENLRASRMEAEANEAIRTQIASLAPEQRVFLGAMAQANAAYRRNPDAFTGMEEYMELAAQLEEAKKNDPSLSGDQVRLATLALDLAQQKNPEGSAADLQRDRDRILQALGYRYLQSQTLRGNQTPEETVTETPEGGVTPLENRPALQAMLDSLPEGHALRKEWEERLAQEEGEELSDVEKKLKEAGALEMKAAGPGDPYGSYGRFEDGTYGYVDRTTGEVVRVSATSVGGQNIAAVFAGTPLPGQAQVGAPDSGVVLGPEQAIPSKRQRFVNSLRHARESLRDGTMSPEDYETFVNTAGGAFGTEHFSLDDRRLWASLIPRWRLPDDYTPTTEQQPEMSQLEKYEYMKRGVEEGTLTDEQFKEFLLIPDPSWDDELTQSFLEQAIEAGQLTREEVLERGLTPPTPYRPPPTPPTPLTDFGPKL
jgi:hypothetical protein